MRRTLTDNDRENLHPKITIPITNVFLPPAMNDIHGHTYKGEI
jgi:hypothetical protein